jgi:uncharacterized phage-associated protein
MASALDVARYLVDLAAAESEPDYLSHLRLQKLLYYVQGWSLALRHKPMFSSRIEAWAHGPVVRDLYPKFAGHGMKSLTPEDVGEAKSLTKEDRRFIAEVWEVYKDYSATSLRNMTHNEPPWIDARQGCDAVEKCANEITHKAMRLFFTKAIAS